MRIKPICLVKEDTLNKEKADTASIALIYRSQLENVTIVYLHHPAIRRGGSLESIHNTIPG